MSRPSISSDRQRHLDDIQAEARSRRRAQGQFSYHLDERRAARYLVDLTGVGAGTDPVGFLILSHMALVHELKELRGEPLKELPPEGPGSTVVTITVSGPAKSGKTTILNLIRNTLDRRWWQGIVRLAYEEKTEGDQCGSSSSI